jgi:hypothetical protein
MRWLWRLLWSNRICAHSSLMERCIDYVSFLMQKHTPSLQDWNVPEELHVISPSMYKFYGNLEDPQRHWESVTGLLKKGNISIPWGDWNVPEELHIISPSMYKFYGDLEDPQRHWESVIGLLKKGNIFVPWGVVGDMIALTFGSITYENKAPITLNAKLILRKPSLFLSI